MLKNRVYKTPLVLQQLQCMPVRTLAHDSERGSALFYDEQLCIYLLESLQDRVHTGKIKIPNQATNLTDANWF